MAKQDHFDVLHLSEVASIRTKNIFLLDTTLRAGDNTPERQPPADMTPILNDSWWIGRSLRSAMGNDGFPGGVSGGGDGRSNGRGNGDGGES